MVTQAIVNLPTPSTTSESESAKTQSTSVGGPSVQPPEYESLQAHNPNVVRISTL